MSTALVLLDLQVGLCTLPPGGGAAPLAEAVAARGVLRAAARALEHARDRDTVVVHVHLAFDERFANRTNRTSRFDEHEQMRRFVAGSDGVRFCDEVIPIAGELVFAKGSVGPFASTPLEIALRARGVETLVVGGVATHLAVESTVREAADRGFTVVVLEDACAAPAEHLHRTAVGETLPLFAQVRRSDDVLGGLA